MKRLLELDKDEALRYLSSQAHPMDNIVERIRFSGFGLLAAINAKCQKIDNLTSQISIGYHKLEALETNICSYLDLDLEQRNALVLLPDVADPRVKRLSGKFFRLLNHVWALKGERLKLYDKIKRL